MAALPSKFAKRVEKGSTTHVLEASNKVFKIWGFYRVRTKGKAKGQLVRKLCVSCTLEAALLGWRMFKYKFMSTCTTCGCDAVPEDFAL